jgi:hypothetical protein
MVVCGIPVVSGIVGSLGKLGSVGVVTVCGMLGSCGTDGGLGIFGWLGTLDEDGALGGLTGCVSSLFWASAATLKIIKSKKQSDTKIATAFLILLVFIC